MDHEPFDYDPDQINFSEEDAALGKDEVGAAYLPTSNHKSDVGFYERHAPNGEILEVNEGPVVYTYGALAIQNDALVFVTHGVAIPLSPSLDYYHSFLRSYFIGQTMQAKVQRENMLVLDLCTIEPEDEGSADLLDEQRGALPDWLKDL